jgi:hypothetical protein
MIPLHTLISLSDHLIAHFGVILLNNPVQADLHILGHP